MNTTALSQNTLQRMMHYLGLDLWDMEAALQLDSLHKVVHTFPRSAILYINEDMKMQSWCGKLVRHDILQPRICSDLVERRRRAVIDTVLQQPWGTKLSGLERGLEATCVRHRQTAMTYNCCSAHNITKEPVPIYLSEALCCALLRRCGMRALRVGASYPQ